MEFKLVYIVLAMLGLLMHIGFRLQTRSNKTESISLKYWIKDNWLDVAMALLSVITILLMMDEVMLFLGITTIDNNDNFYKLTAFFAGLFNVALIRDIKKMVIKRQDN